MKIINNNFGRSFELRSEILNFQQKSGPDIWNPILIKNRNSGFIINNVFNENREPPLKQNTSHKLHKRLHIIP